MANEFYQKMVRAMNALWDEMEDDASFEDNLAQLPEELRDLLYGHPLVQAFDLLP